jgi:hypothetical protein
MDKKCTVCKETLFFSNFCKDRSRGDGYSTKCKTCAYQMVLNKKEYNKEVFAERTRLYTEKYRSKLSIEEKERVKAHQREHIKLPSVKAKRNEVCRRYYATKNNATPNWLTKEQKSLMADFYFLAKDCELVTGELYHVDHIVPLMGKDVCGLHVPWNLQVLPSDLNMKKSNRF